MALREPEVRHARRFGGMRRVGLSYGVPRAGAAASRRRGRNAVVTI